jgi:hypothetical protein
MMFTEMSDAEAIIVISHVRDGVTTPEKTITEYVLKFHNIEVLFLLFICLLDIVTNSSH